jgi:hypothetical protein
MDLHTVIGAAGTLVAVALGFVVASRKQPADLTPVSEDWLRQFRRRGEEDALV